MGICSSCIGYGRRDRGDIKNPETSRLLNEDPYRSQYGATGQSQAWQQYQPDPESVRREREAMESLCHAMSDEVVDVYSVMPRSSSERLAAPPETPSTGDRPVSPRIRVLESKESVPQELTYRCVRQPRRGRISSGIGKTEDEAAKAVMG